VFKALAGEDSGTVLVTAPAEIANVVTVESLDTRCNGLYMRPQETF